METRIQPQTKIEVRKDSEGNDTRTLFGHAAVFYNGKEETQFRWCNDFVERIAPGAFKRAVAEDDVRGLFNHDANLILGRNVAGTLRMEEDKDGLYYEIDLPETNQADSVLQAVKRGDITGNSFSFIAMGESYTTEGEQDEITVRTITEVRLFDVGPVTFPAYKGTEVQARCEREALESRNAYIAEQKTEEQKRAVRRRKIITEARVREIDSI